MSEPADMLLYPALTKSGMVYEPMRHVVWYGIVEFNVPLDTV